MLNLTPEQLLTTSRSARKRFDFQRPVDLEVIRECIESALSTPSNLPLPTWQFVVITDPDKKDKFAQLYRRAWDNHYRNLPNSIYTYTPDNEEARLTQQQLIESLEYLRDHLQQMPVLVIPCYAGRVDSSSNMNTLMTSPYGASLPAVWNFIQAARSRGLECAWTTSHLFLEQEAARLLKIPYEKMTQCCLLPLAYPIGVEFKTTSRKNIDEVIHLNGW
ncbi:MAG: nitroreductase family protein [Anaerolineae bacterium]|jgi:nitroreductase|nr:nitroreductase family protein [Anaerolineae bacterium]